MDTTFYSKIVPLHELVVHLEHRREQGRTIVQSHGVFDLIHPGIITHLESARKQGDILVVTVIKDKDVRRGPGRPIFPETLRAESVAALQGVDYVSIVDDEEPFECVRTIKPDVFAKGQAFKERDRKTDQKIFEEEREFYFGKSKIYETKGFSLSSTHIVNNFLQIYPEETQVFLKNFAARHSFHDIVEAIESLRDLKVLLIGEGIIDEYHYCSAMGKSAKSHLVVSRYLAHEVFNGGAFAIANHLAGICDKVDLVTLLGRQDSREEFIRENLKENIVPAFFYRDDASTVIKKRYLDQYLNQKIFEVNYLNDDFICESLERDIVSYLEARIPDYDIVLVSDFGHGFITERIKEVIQKKSRKYAVNTQTNAANAGYNLITKYQKPYFVCLDESEIRLAAQQRHENIRLIAQKIQKSIDTKYLIVTLGKKGSIGIDNSHEVNMTPIFSSKVIDTIGAGDAFFAFTAPCVAKDFALDVVSFIGNAVGALAVQIVGNKRPVEKYELITFMDAMLR
ncbi:MAG: adenylyltransferase/cytidyltransferase family protein [Nitrospirae bacterium]|nr:adenylyltransferase/cytidyltransferase family protein [Nitrospirota bacterium]